MNRDGRPANQLFWGKEHPCSKWLQVLNKLPPSLFDWCGGELLGYFPGFIELLQRLDKKHTHALTSNLANLPSVQELATSGLQSRFATMTCSWHREGKLSKEDFLERVGLLRAADFPVSINIVDHGELGVVKAEADFFRQFALTVNVSPFEDPNLIEKLDKTLICNAGVNTFAVDNVGDVYRCLTWYRSRFREEGKMGNLFAGTFKPFQHEQTCNLKCDIYYILDPRHVHKEMFSTCVRPFESSPVLVSENPR